MYDGQIFYKTVEYKVPFKFISGHLFFVVFSISRLVSSFCHFWFLNYLSDHVNWRRILLLITILFRWPNDARLTRNYELMLPGQISLRHPCSICKTKKLFILSLCLKLVRTLTLPQNNPKVKLSLPANFKYLYACASSRHYFVDITTNYCF